jgi:hypothetical protein
MDTIEELLTQIVEELKGIRQELVSMSSTRSRAPEDLKKVLSSIRDMMPAQYRGVFDAATNTTTESK